MEEFKFFWKGPLSQWAKSTFRGEDGTTYCCAEQYMMHQKALLFKDQEIADEIMSVTHPKDHQDLGRKVKGYDQAKWDKVKEIIVIDGNYCKFTQNNKFKNILLETGDLELVEASPMDKVWGIKMAEDHPDVRDRTKWRGQNLLGKCLMEVRNRIQHEG